MNNLVLISLGSNLGNRAQWLRFGLDRLQKGGRILATSSVYVTTPVGVDVQSDYFNASLCLYSWLEPMELLHFCQEIELASGRTGKGQLLPRQLDIDIILFGNRIIETDACTVPHPRMHERAFVLGPSADICPYLRHPILGQTVQELFHNPTIQSQTIEKTFVWP